MVWALFFRVRGKGKSPEKACREAWPRAGEAVVMRQDLDWAGCNEVLEKGV